VSILCPVIPIEAPILNSLGEMLRGHPLRVVKISDGAADFKNPVVRAGAKPHAANGHFERALAGIIERAQSPQGTRRDMRIVETAVLLERTGSLHPGAYLGGGGTLVLAAQFLVRNRRHLDMEIDTVEQRPADFAQVPLNDCASAAAFACRVRIKSAWTSVQVTVVQLRGPCAFPILACRTLSKPSATRFVCGG